MADHPFANAGLGMFGSAENAFAKGAMQGGSSEGGPIGDFLASLIGLSTQDKSKKQADATKPVAAVPPAPQYEPQTAFPEVLQQQYVTPYKPGYGAGPAMPPPTTSLPGFMTQPYRAPQAPAPADPMAGFKTTNPFVTQPQTTASGYHPVTDALWGTK